MGKQWRDKDEFIRHLRNRRVQLGLSQEAVSSKLSKSRSYVTMIESGRGFPPLEVLAELARIYGEDVEDYISIRTGGAPADESLKSLVEQLVKEPLTEYAIEAVPVPVLTLAQCEDWIDFNDKDFPMNAAETFHLAQTGDSKAFYIRADDTAMAPTIGAGDLVLVEPSGPQPEDGDIVLARSGEHAIIRRLHITEDGRIILSAMNHDTPPVPVKKKGFKCFRCTGAYSRF